MNIILVFQDGELIKQIAYKTKVQARKQYSHLKKNGILCPLTGNKIHKASFELIS